MDEFFASGGTTAFVDRVTGALGIHASQVKIVSVYEGSVVLNYDILPEENEDEDADTTPEEKSKAAQDRLAEIKALQTEKFATNAMDLGAPIIDVQVTTVVSEPAEETSAAAPAAPESIVSSGIVSAQGYDPVVITEGYAPPPSEDEDGGEEHGIGAIGIVCLVITGILVAYSIFMGVQYLVKKYRGGGDGPTVVQDDAGVPQDGDGSQLDVHGKASDLVPMNILN